MTFSTRSSEDDKNDDLVADLTELYESPAHLTRLVYNLRVPQSERRNIPKWLEEECEDCFNSSFDDAMSAIDTTEKRKRIVDLCGDCDQGVVAPTQWPPS